ncbi:MAG: cell division protein SepF [Clostridia bacterium]|jgi:FtsZ-interacting cell division protein YlmF|nr:cell division protein SepF [Clostridia bacterium]
MADFKTRFKDLIGFGSTESVARDTSSYVDEDVNDFYDEAQVDEIENFDDSESEEDIFASSDYTSYASAGTSSGAKARARSGRSSSYAGERASSNSSDRSRILNMGAASNLRVVLSKPYEYDDCQIVGEHLKGHMTVVLNLELVRNASDKRRIYDFVSGCCFALDCNIQRVSEMIYIIAPREVDIFSEAEEEEEDSIASFLF